MKRILFSLLVATLPFGSVLADAPKEKNAKVTLVYQHELPNVPGKSIKGVLVEYGPGGYSPGHTHPKSAFIYATVLEGGDPQSGQRRTGDDLQGRTELVRGARRAPQGQRQCQQDGAGQAPRGVRAGYERDGTGDPIRKLRFSPCAKMARQVTAQRGHDPVHDVVQNRTSRVRTRPPFEC